MREISKHRTKLAAFTLVLLLSMAIFFVAILPTVSALPTVATYPFIEAIPNPVGVDQPTQINTGALNFLNTAEDGWNVTIHVVDPQGEETDLGPFKTFSTGTYGTIFVPDQVGIYKIKTVFPEQDYAGATYLASESEVVELEVLADPVLTYPGYSPPTEYWTRPVDTQLREWWTSMGSWLAEPQNLWAPYNDGPETPHILWQMPIGDTQGGLVQTDLGPHGMNDGDAYEGKFGGSIILNGIFYYNKKWSGFFSRPEPQTVVAVDIHTGEVLWEREFPYGDGRVDFGQIYYHDSINNRGAHSYIVFTEGSSWIFCEAYTGDYLFTITGVPGGSNYYGPSGEILKYDVDNIGNSTNPDWRLTRWNTVPTVQFGGFGFFAESWAPAALGNKDAANGYDMNVSIPALNLPGADLPGNILKVFVGDKVIGGRVTQTEVNLWGIGLEDGNRGSLLYNTTWNAPSEWVQGNLTIGGIGQAGWVAWSQEDQVAVFLTKENRRHYAFNTENGQFKYQTEPQIYADAWSDTVTEFFGPDRIIAYGKLYSATVGGIVYCYDVNNGTRLWEYVVDDPYTESYISNRWWVIPLFATDGKIYFGSLEHSALNPKPRGAPMFALDAETGDVVWRADGLFRQTRWGGRAIIGDSIIATMDTYDQRVYAIGKGPSATTVSIQSDVIPHGSSVIIKGTVTDVSPGTKEYALTARFPNGVPAVAGEDMSEWMLYVYKQFPIPIDVTGVPVSLDTIDPNGNFIHIGDVTTDGYSGTFGYMFTPEVPGTYTIMATFIGDESYGSSFAQTYLGVGEAPEPLPKYGSPEWPAYPEPEKPADYTPMFLGIIVAVAITICLVLYTLWTVRKQRR